MKFWVLGLLPIAVHGASFLAHPRASLVGQALNHDQKEMPLTKHNKTAGSGYEKGSPLYAKQQQRKEDGISSKPPAPPAEGAALPPPEKPEDIPKTYQHYANRYVLSWAGFWYFLGQTISWFIIAFLWSLCWSRRESSYAYLRRREKSVYERPAAWEPEYPEPRKTWSYGLFSLDHCCGSGGKDGGHHHMSLCLCGFFCAPLRIADTWSKQPKPLIGGFWIALFVVCLLSFLSPWTAGWSGALFLCICIGFRQKLRRQYGMDAGNCTTYLEDIAAWCCCSFCAMLQEARQVEYTTKRDDDDPNAKTRD